jgi:hypothetical protein
VIEIDEENKIKGLELLVATSLFIPDLSQIGTKITAPPKPNDAPKSPAKNPDTIVIFLRYGVRGTY